MPSFSTAAPMARRITRAPFRRIFVACHHASFIFVHEKEVELRGIGSNEARACSLPGEPELVL